MVVNHTEKISVPSTCSVELRAILHEMYKMNYGKVISGCPNVIWPKLLKTGFDGMRFVTFQFNPTLYEAQI